MTGKDYKRIRFRMNITQKDAADMIGISRFALSGYESGRVGIPITVSMKLNRLYRLSDSDINGKFD